VKTKTRRRKTAAPVIGPLHYGRMKVWSTDSNKSARLVDGPGWFIGQQNGLDIGQVYCTASQCPKTMEGFAKLFCAAPDLLAALTAILHEVSGDYDGWAQDAVSAARIKQLAREAIAAAESP
jgi:hypothetical protein